MTLLEFQTICESYGLDKTPNLGEKSSYGRINKGQVINYVFTYYHGYVNAYLTIDRRNSTKLAIYTKPVGKNIDSVDELKKSIEQYLKNEKQFLKDYRKQLIEEL